MASKYVCACGEVVRTNLYEGHGLHLLVPEGLTDVADEPTDSPLIDEIIRESDVVAECPKCKRLAIVNTDYKVRFYEATESNRWEVWRQDDNGNELRLASGLSQSDAKSIVDEYERHGHKQMYWATEGKNGAA